MEAVTAVTPCPRYCLSVPSASETEDDHGHPPVASAGRGANVNGALEGRRPAVPAGLTGLLPLPNELASYPNETLEMVTDGFGTSEITNGTELFAIVYVG